MGMDQDPCHHTVALNKRVAVPPPSDSGLHHDALYEILQYLWVYNYISLVYIIIDMVYVLIYVYC